MQINAATPTPPAKEPACNEGTTYDMRMCWSKQDDAANAQMNRNYATLAATMPKNGGNPAALKGAQAAWTGMRDKTCAFEYALYEEGTIAPLLAVQCETRITTARAQRLAAEQSVLERAGKAPPLQPLAPQAAAGHNRLDAQYQSRLTLSQRNALAAAELAWTAYREKTCALEGGACLTELTKERIVELEAAWVGEPFW